MAKKQQNKSIRTKKDLKTNTTSSQEKSASADVQNDKVTKPVASISDAPEKNTNSNHPEWYTHNDTLTKSLGVINFSGFKGVRNSLLLQRTPYTGAEFDLNIGTKLEIIENRFPGIMIHDYYHTFGALTSTGNDAEEISRIIYANLRRAISGRRTYDSNTVLQYILAVGSLQAAFGELHRVLAAVSVRSVVNKYYGERLVEALGYNYQDISNNYNSYVSKLTHVAYSAQTLVLPQGMDLFKRWFWLSSSVFLDQPDHRSGLIAFKPKGFWEFKALDVKIKDEVKQIVSELQSEGLTADKLENEDTIWELGTVPSGVQTAPFGLVYTTFPETENVDRESSRFYQVLGMLESAIFRYSENSDFATIAGDMLRTYGEDLVIIPEFTRDATLEITYDDGVLQSTKNISYVPFHPVAILEFPSTSLVRRNRRRGMFYAIQTEDIFTIPLLGPKVITPESSPSKRKTSELINPIESYVFSIKEDVTPGEAMSLLKWSARYRVTKTISSGNVFVLNKKESTEVFRQGAIYIETMGTELITASHIFGIVDHFENAQYREQWDNQTRNTTTYGMIKITWNYSNYQYIQRYVHPQEQNDEVTRDLSFRSVVQSADTLRYQNWMRHWQSAPVLFHVFIDELIAPMTSDENNNHFKYGIVADLMTLNPYQYYNVISTDVMRRHHEVALASMLGLGIWGVTATSSTGIGKFGSLTSPHSIKYKE